MKTQIRFAYLFMRHQTKLTEKIRKGKEINYLLHEHALFSKRIF